MSKEKTMNSFRKPIVVGTTMFFNSPRQDCLRALDTRTGTEKWRYFTDGPVRFAAVAWEDRVYFTSDDGHLYCLQQDQVQKSKSHWR